MSTTKKNIRQAFRSAVFVRDGHKCRMCHVPATQALALDAHHITDRNLMPNGGYVPENGISLCPVCHEKAEVFHSTGTSLPNFSPEELYVLIGSSYELAVSKSQKLDKT